MNSKYFWIFFFCSLLSVFSGCRNDDDFAGGGKLTISSVSVVSSENTRSSSTTLTSGSIGVYLSGTTGYQNKIYRYDYSGGTWVANPTDIFLNTNPASICAFYPYNSSITDPTNISLTSQLCTTDNDLVYSPVVSPSPSNQSNRVTFNMKHAYSKLTFIIQNIALPAPCKIDQIQVSNPSFLSTGTINITSESYTKGTVAGTMSGNPNIASIAKGSSATASFLVVPSDNLSGDITVKCTVDGQEKTAKFDVASYKLTTIAPGQDYQIYLSLGYSLVESNCYIVKPNNIVYIPISRANNAWNTAGLGTAIPNGDNWSSGLEWTDNSNGMGSYGAIQSITSNQQGGYIAVRTGSTTGNAVVYLKNSTGDTVWSWHLWVTDYDPNNGTTYTYSNGTESYTFMDRNLGASSKLGDTSVDPASQNSRGLIYQWGRKDPFPGANNISGTTDRSIYDASGNGISIFKVNCNASTNLTNSINNPMTFYFNNSGLYDWYTNASAINHQDNLWGGASTVAPDAKTVFDPCPVGWRVPAWNTSASPWAGITLSGATWANYGYTFPSPPMGYYPAAGDRNYASGNLSNVGLTGEYWSASVDGNDAHYWYMDSSRNINSSASKPRATGMSVRCVKE